MIGLASNPLDAYASDVARRAAGAGNAHAPFGEHDSAWVALAHALWREALSHDRKRGGTRQGVPGAPSTIVERALRDCEEHPGAGTWVERAAAVATRMEDAAAFNLSVSMLSALCRLAVSESALVRGRLLAQWARVERQRGEYDIAADLYEQTRRLGVRANEPDLLTRADLGLGVLARIRGNYPEARERFRHALARAEHGGLRELTGIAHQALFVAAATARDFDTALEHGWAALAHAAGDPMREVDTLINLAALCLDAGQERGALQGYLAAAGRATVSRARLPALAGAALAAARLGDPVSAGYAAEVERELASDARPYERAQLLHVLSLAHAAAGRTAHAAVLREQGLALAQECGFAELVHQYLADESAERAAARAAERAEAARALSRQATRVVDALSNLPGEPALATAVRYAG